MDQVTHFLLSPPKTGTTSIWTYMRASPRHDVGRIKEPKWLTRAAYPACGPGDADQFSRKPDCEETYLANYASGIGVDCSADNFVFPHAPINWLQARGFTQHPRAIVVLRNPADRLVSAYQMMVRDQRETLPFDQAILAESKRIEQGWSIGWWYLQASLYFHRCAYIKAHYDASFFLFEDIFADQSAFETFACEAFGLDKGALTAPVPHTNISGQPNPAYHLIRSLFHRFFKPLGLQGEGKIVSAIAASLLTRRDNRPALPDWVMETLHQDIEQLATLFPAVQRWIKS